MPKELQWLKTTFHLTQLTELGLWFKLFQIIVLPNVAPSLFNTLSPSVQCEESEMGLRWVVNMQIE